MRGKRSDPEFVSRFIQESVKVGAQTPQAIAKRAREQIEQIDAEIRALETKKVVRSKLLDVIASFEAPDKNKTEEAKLLPFFNINYPQKCKEICELLHREKSIPLLTWMGGWKTEQIAELNFCIKQLKEANIIARSGESILCGERFDEYMKFVLREDE